MWKPWVSNVSIENDVNNGRKPCVSDVSIENYVNINRSKKID